MSARECKLYGLQALGCVFILEKILKMDLLAGHNDYENKDFILERTAHHGTKCYTLGPNPVAAGLFSLTPLK